MEDWKPFGDGNYEASNKGRIRRKADGVNTYQGKIKKPSLSSNGYMIVGCFTNGKRTNVLVHRAVAESFIGTCPDQHQVNHKDGNKQNNNISNLEYVTVSGNAIHAFKTGLSSPPTQRAKGNDHWTRQHPEKLKRGDDNPSRSRPDRLSRGETCKCSKLVDDNIREIRALSAEGFSMNQIAAMFNISRRNVSYILEGKTWKHVK